MAKDLMPAAELESRPGDMRLTPEQYLKLSLFSQLKTKVPVEQFPNTLVVRSYRKNAVICRQGEAGMTAFYLLTSEDARGILQDQQEDADEKQRRTLEKVNQRLAQMQGAAWNDPLRTAAQVFLAVPRSEAAQPRGLLARLKRRVFGTGATAKGERPRYIPIDGPRALDYDSLQDVMFEGELFGEMSCLHRTPRSATVVASRDCYVLEMLRNIFDRINKDEGYQKKADESYKQRVLKNHLRKLSIFQELDEAQFEEIKQSVDLLRVKVGSVICDEHDHSDSMFIIRRGLVKVLQNVSSLLRPQDVPNPAALRKVLREAGQQPATPAGQIRAQLPETLRNSLGNATENPSVEVLVRALNDLLKNPQFAKPAALQQLIASPSFRERLADLPADSKEWSELDRRRCHRLLLTVVFPGLLAPPAAAVGPPRILSYLSRGEFLGEMGLLKREPRSATCVAAGHPEELMGLKEKDLPEVELVRIPEQLFWRLMEQAPAVRAQVEKRIAAREKSDRERRQAPAWKDTQAAPFTETFAQLGLIQGQRLMLIDLDRCTRCDECVKACVNTHTDGRSRLFLDGPRFDKYLIPTTCRSCLDPLCMIGCPVGSINRGDNGQILIKDWCIGCGLCETNCPYGSIQMHDVGVIPETTRGWRYQSADPEAETRLDWTAPGFQDGGWFSGTSPFVPDRAFQETLGEIAPGQALQFRYEFRLGPERLADQNHFRLILTCVDPEAVVWVNGQEVAREKAPKSNGEREYALAPGNNPLRPGRNVLAVKVMAVPGSKIPFLLKLRLDEEVRLSEELKEKTVKEKAVVCDLCSSLPGQVPACVHACPHDAAMRVDARFNFPRGS